MAVSLVIKKILPVCYKKHPYHSYVFLGCLLRSSILTSTNQLTLQDERELKSHVCSRQCQDQNPVPGPTWVVGLQLIYVIINAVRD